MGSTPVALISEIVATRYWGHTIQSQRDSPAIQRPGQPLGRSSAWSATCEIRCAERAADGVSALRAKPGGTTRLIDGRTTGEPMRLVESVRSEIRAVNPTGSEVRVAESDRVRRSYVSTAAIHDVAHRVLRHPRFAGLSGSVYGVTANWVAARTFELGVRCSRRAVS